MRQAVTVLAILSYVFTHLSYLPPILHIFFLQKLYNSMFEARFVYHRMDYIPVYTVKI
jgi:hypothetical protein